MRKLLPALALLLSGCVAEIKTDKEHQYKPVVDFSGKEDPNYLVSVKNEESTYRLDDMITLLNAAARAKKRSLSSICGEADTSGDHVIDFSEYANFMRKEGNFEAAMY